MKREKTNNNLITALYCRLSKDDRTYAESMSISNQKEMLKEYAKKNGFLNCQFYIDDGYSGTNFDRPSFQEMIEDIRNGKIVTVITKDLSRLGRNYLETGTYIEVFFPNHNVRYIAINDGVDSADKEQMDITPFRNIINEMYAKDTSKKVKSAIYARRTSGKYMATTPPFGYCKDEKDHNHLVIDGVTAQIVDHIYELAEEGLGLHGICKRLREEKVLKPCFYKPELFARFVEHEDTMYDWSSAYVSNILHNPIYAGHITLANRPTRTMHSKKRQYIPIAEREIIRNTHEPIIEQSRWDNVQKIMAARSNSFQSDKTEYDNIFRGIVKCADCGSSMLVKVVHARKRNDILDKTLYFCCKYRKYGTKVCSAHTLEARMLYDAVLKDIQKHARQAVSDRKVMLNEIAEKLNLQLLKDQANQKKELKQCRKRISDIENVYARLYEDLSKNLIPESRFRMLTLRLDEEQEELNARILQLEKIAIADKEQGEKVKRFVAEVSEYNGITELNYKVLHQLIDKILVFQAEEINGEKVQRLKIYYKFVGALENER